MDREKLEQVITDAVSSLGCELWGVEYLQSGGLIRVYIDADSGVTLEQCQLASKQINSLLHVENPDSNFNLEVSSPGLERLIFYTYQYNDFIGETLKVKLLLPQDGKGRIRGLLKAVHEDSIELETDTEICIVAFNNIAKAQLVYRF